MNLNLSLLRRLAISLPLYLTTISVPLWAQYPGHIDTKTKTAVNPRAVAVLEWTGEAGKPKASRLVPVTVFDGQAFQDGGVYLARPQPLALQSETEYELEKAGLPEGWYDVRFAEQVAGDWFGFGGWKPFTEPAPPKLKAAKELPKVVREEGGGSGPHFKEGTRADKSTSAPPAEQTSAGAKAGSGGAPAADGGKGSATSAQDSTTTGAETPDPEQPTLRRRKPGSAGTKSGDAPSVAAVPEAAGDPDRPRLTRNAPAAGPGEPQRLLGTPADMQQTVAVSDATNRDSQPFAYSWADPADAQKFQTEMESIAKKAVANANSGASGTPLQTGAIRQPARPEAARAARQRRWTDARSGAHPELENVQFHAYALTYGGGATLVLSADAVDAGGTEAAGKSVTVIAQPDIYGALRVVFTAVSDATHLEIAPRMRLVDAVDAAGDRRGDLLFELRGSRERRFALYRVAGGRADQVFLGDALPLS